MFYNPKVIEQYNVLHKVCPICGSTNYEQTTMGFAASSLKTAINRNYCRCSCGWNGRVNDLIPKIGDC